MNRRSLPAFLIPMFLALGVVSTALATAQSSSAGGETLLLVGGTLVDGTGAPPVPNAWIRIEEGTVAAVGQGAPPEPGNARVIRLEGKTVIPGLADMHVHLGNLASARWMLKLFLAHGVTNVMDTGNSLGNLAAIRRWTAEQEAVPHVFTSGYVVQGSYEEQRFLQPGREAERMVEDELAFGVDFIKTYNWTSSGALKQIASMAAKQNVPITGHTPLSMSSLGSIDAGIQILQHVRIRPYEVLDDLEIVARYPVDESLMKRTAFWAHFEPDGRAVGQTLAGWEKRKDKFFVTPTLVVQEAVAQSYDYPHPRFTENPEVRLLSPGALERFKKSSPPVHWGELNAEEVAEAKASFEGMAAFIRLAHARGIRILSGTDAPVPWLVPGPSLLRELRYFVEKAGMTPAEAVHSSTGRAAQALRVSDRGTIEAGKAADLVILDGDLASDLGALDKIEQVVLNGTIYGKDQLLKEAADWAAQDGPAEATDESN